MAGRCVTRGTDAGLVYYSAISTSKTAKKGRDGRGEGGRRERANLAARSKEWRTSQITRLLCDTQPSLEFFSSRGKENLLVDEEIPAKRQRARARARGIVLKIGFFAAVEISPCARMNDAVERRKSKFNLPR